MRLTNARAAVTTVVLAAVLIPYVGYVIRGDMPFVQDARGMAGVGLVGLALIFAAWGLRLQTFSGKAMAVIGVGAAALGAAAALVGTEGSDRLLGLFVGALILVWAAETLLHTRPSRRHA